MKTFYNTLIISLLVLAFVQAQEKRALIVAIGNYQEDSGWGRINSNNDTLILKEMLKRQSFSDIQVLSDSKATKKGVTNAFNDLLNRSGKSDILFIHFSTHGQQVEDLSGDESDGLDEAIVCYGAPMKATEGYKGEEHLLDDELGSWILKLRSKIGTTGDIILVADACYSGSISRGNQLKRGGAEPLSLTGKKLSSSSTKREVFMGETKVPYNETELSPFVVISAASADQPNFECIGKDFKNYGSLSYAFNQVISKVSEQETYKSFFAKLQVEMKLLVQNQNPEIEGAADRVLFGGKTVSSNGYINVKVMSSNQFEIDAGQLHQVYKGSKIELLPIGEYKVASRSQGLIGTVVKEGLFTSEVQTSENINSGNYWGYIVEKSYGDIRVGVDLSQLKDAQLKQNISESLAKSAIINLDSSKPEIAIAQNPSNANELQIVLLANGEFLGSSIKQLKSGEHLKRMQEKIENFSKAQFLLNFNPYTEGLDAYLEIKPTTSRYLADTISVNQFIQNGVVSLDTTQRIFLKVVSESSQKLYFNIIEIDPEGNIAVIAPTSADFDGKEYAIEAGKSMIIPRMNINGSLNVLNVNPPFGNETIKLVLSDRPIDLRGLASKRGNSRGLGELSPLEKVFDFAGNLSSRGVENESYPTAAKATVYNLNFTITR